MEFAIRTTVLVYDPRHSRPSPTCSSRSVIERVRPGSTTLGGGINSRPRRLYRRVVPKRANPSEKPHNCLAHSSCAACRLGGEHHDADGTPSDSTKCRCQVCESWGRIL